MHDHTSQDRSPTPAQVCEPSGAGANPDPVREYHEIACQLLEDSPEEAAHQLDKKIAWIMAHYSGYTLAAIKQAMREASVHLTRHGGDAQAYVERTVDEAMHDDPFGETVLGWDA